MSLNVLSTLRFGSRLRRNHCFVTRGLWNHMSIKCECPSLKIPSINITNPNQLLQIRKLSDSNGSVPKINSRKPNSNRNSTVKPRPNLLVSTPPPSLDMTNFTHDELASLLFYFSKYPNKMRTVDYTLVDILRLFRYGYSNDSTAAGLSNDTSVVSGNTDAGRVVDEPIQYTDKQLGMVLYSMKSLVLADADIKHGPARPDSAHGKVFPLETTGKVYQLILEIIENSPSQWSPKTCRMALYALQNMLSFSGTSISSKYYDGRQEDSVFADVAWDSIVSGEQKILLLISSKINEYSKNNDLVLFSTPREIAMSLYGLRNLSSNYEEVRLLVNAVADQMPTSYTLTPTEAGSDADSSADADLNSNLFKSTSIPANVYPHSTRSQHQALELNIGGVVSSRDVSNSLFGLQKLSSACAETRSLIIKLLPMINACTYALGNNSKLSRPSPQELDNSLFGLKTCSSYTREVHLLIKALLPYIAHCNTTDKPLKPFNISAALHGLQNLSSKHEIVRELLTTFNGLLIQQQYIFNELPHSESNEKEELGADDADHDKSKSLACSAVKRLTTMSGLGIANALYGLRNMSCNYREVRETVELLTPYLQLEKNSENDGQGISSKNIGDSQSKSVNYFKSPHHISNAIYGLRKMSSRYEETRRLLTALTGVINYNQKHTAADFTNAGFIMKPQEVGNLIYGLQSLSSDDFEVKNIIRAITPIISTCVEPMSGTNIAGMLYGMRLLSINEIEVAVLWNIITHFMTMGSKALKASRTSASDRDRLMMKPGEVSMALYGLSNSSSDYPEIREVIELLTPLIAEYGDSGSVVVGATDRCLMVYGLRNMSTQYTEVLELIDRLIPLLSAPYHPDAFNDSPNGTGIIGSHPLFSKHHIFMCIVGLQNLHPSTPQSKALYTVITSFIHHYEDNIYAWTAKSQLAMDVVKDLEKKYGIESVDLEGFESGVGSESLVYSSAQSGGHRVCIPPPIPKDKIHRLYPELQLLIHTFKYALMYSNNSNERTQDSLCSMVIDETMLGQSSHNDGEFIKRGEMNGAKKHESSKEIDREHEKYIALLMTDDEKSK